MVETKMLSTFASLPRVPLEAQLEVALHVGPLAGEDAVQHRVAHGAVATRGVVADDAVLLRAERLDRSLRGEVEVVGAQAHHLAAQLVESVPEQQQLACRVHLAALPLP